MLARHWLTAYRAAALLAVLASSLLFIHYLAPADSDFCGDKSGCEAVRQAGFNYFLGSTYINVPLFGILAYGFMLILAWGQPTKKRLNVVRILAAVGGFIALLFVLAQALLIKAYCWLCLIVDVSAVVAAFAAIAAYQAAEEQAEVLPSWSWSGLLVAVIGLPLLWYGVRPLPPVPPLVRELYQPGKINVIEFADFQCPYCRKLHPMLKELVKDYPGKVVLRRLHMPLESHNMAAGAARVAVCAAKQGQEDAMADLLFEGRLGADAYAGYVEQLKLDKPQFDACLDDPATQARIDEDIGRFRKSNLRGLPTTFIGDEKITGLRPVASFKEAFEKAATTSTDFQLSGGLFFAISALLAGGLIGGGVLARKSSAS